MLCVVRWQESMYIESQQSMSSVVHYSYKSFSYLQVLHFQLVCQWTIVFVIFRQSLVRQTTLSRMRMLWKCKLSLHLPSKGRYLSLKSYPCKRVFAIKVYLWIYSKVMCLVCSSLVVDTGCAVITFKFTCLPDCGHCTMSLASAAVTPHWIEPSDGSVGVIHMIIHIFTILTDKYVLMMKWSWCSSYIIHVYQRFVSAQVFADPQWCAVFLFVYHSTWLQQSCALELQFFSTSNWKCQPCRTRSLEKLNYVTPFIWLFTVASDIFVLSDRGFIVLGACTFQEKEVLKLECVKWLKHTF